MDATSTPANSKLEEIFHSFPALQFAAADEFRWQPTTKSIYYCSDDPLLLERLLHEIAHAELGHEHYHRDIELIEMERDAWDHALRIVAPKFDVLIASSVIEDDLDTYREWLHARSICPTCSGNGLQKADLTYECIACRTTWTANEAKLCGLRRRTKTRPE